MPLWALESAGIALCSLGDIGIRVVNVLEKIHKKYLLSCTWQTGPYAGVMCIRPGAAICRRLQAGLCGPVDGAGSCASAADAPAAGRWAVY